MDNKQDTQRAESAASIPEAALTIRVRFDMDAPFAALHTEGMFSGGSIERRFYSFGENPPDDITPENFWSEVLRCISGYLREDPI